MSGKTSPRPAGFSGRLDQGHQIPRELRRRIERQPLRLREEPLDRFKREARSRRKLGEDGVAVRCKVSRRLDGVILEPTLQVDGFDRIVDGSFVAPVEARGWLQAALIDAGSVYRRPRASAVGALLARTASSRACDSRFLGRA